MSSMSNRHEGYITLSNGTIIYYPLFSDTVLSTSNIDLFINNLVTMIVAYFFSGCIVMFIFSHILYRDKAYVEATNSESDTDEDEEEEDTTDDEDEEEAEQYESKYFDKLEEMPDDKELTTEEFTAIGGHTLTEETPKGLIHMRYNVGTCTFEYYTDKFSDMTYEILDTVARLFAVTFNCKQICVNYRQEVQNGTNRMISDIEYDKMMLENEKEKEKENDKVRSVFASFKSYNKKNGNNVAKKYYVITEKSNRFKFNGKLIDYENTFNKKEAASLPYVNISYNEYKQSNEYKRLKQE